VWKRTVAGKVLHFYLAGINNQNFLMRDRQTGTWWQQVSGKAISGPMHGSSLELASSDELTFGLWKRESPNGQVMAPVAKDQKEYDSKWEAEVNKLPLVLKVPGTALQPRDVVIGIEIGNAARAYPVSSLERQSPLQDRVGGVPVMLALGPDGKSVRTFISWLAGQELEFFRKTDSSEWRLVDASGSEWNFQGCAMSGPAQGKCLERLPALRDFWFDWRQYHPSTSVYQH
jgi:uncharacterized protein DUF3179